MNCCDMRNKFIKLSFLAVASLLLLIILFRIFWYPKITYYQAVEIEVQAEDSLAYGSVYAVSSLGKTIPFSNLKGKNVFTLKPSFLKSIHIDLTNNYDKNLFVKIKIGDKIFAQNLSNETIWLKEKNNNGSQSFVFNGKVEKVFFNVLFSLFYWSIVRKFILISVSLFSILLILWLLRSRKESFKIYFSKKNKFQIIKIFSNSVLLSIAFAWFFIWFFGIKKHGLANIGFWDGILSMIFLFVFLHLVLYLIFLVLSPKFQKKRVNFSILLNALFFAFLLTEIVLRIMGVNANYYERTANTYGPSNYDDGFVEEIFVRKPNDTVSFQTSEFDYFRTTNSLGFCEREFDTTKCDSVFRIFAVGDSYTEGMGVEADATWPNYLFDNLENKSFNVEVFNAGIVGSDPVFAYKIIENILIDFAPDLIILSVNQSDISDAIFRGGMSRFNSDGSVQYNKSPWWEPIFATNYSLRLLMMQGLGYDYHLLSPKQQEKAFENAVFDNFVAIEMVHKFLEKKAVEFFVVFNPISAEVLEGKYFILDRLIDKLQDNNIAFLDLLPQFVEIVNNENINDYFWELDGHYKTQGNKFLADEICKFLVDEIEK